MGSNKNRLLALSLASAILAACGGGGGGSMNPPVNSAPQSAPMSVLVSDASSEDWATIGVKVLSIALVPQGGGANVIVYSASSSPALMNLVQLDQLNEVLANTSVPAGTYTGAQITISANPGDVLLTVAADPEPGFAGTPGATIPSNQIQIQGAQGATGSLTVPVKVVFDSPLVVSANQNNSLDLEVDLAHPAFIIAHTPPAAGGTTLWAVNFKGPIRHRRIDDIAHLVLRHMYGNVNAIASDNTSITITRDEPVLPVVNPEQPVATAQSLQILADATNGTLFYDVDAKTRTTIKDFSTEASTLVGKYVRVAARYQENGTLVATRIWASSDFSKVWLSPEGHIVHVNAANDAMLVSNESGGLTRVMVDANTQFYFHESLNPNPIGSGPAVLASNTVVRGFKVHVAVVDPLATPLVASSVDVETAAYSGTISAANLTSYTQTHVFRTASDDYSVNLDYISAQTANGMDGSGNPVSGFKWWNFAFPTLVESGGSAISDFVSATNGGVSFGGTAGSVSAWGASYAIWGDAANPTGWAIADTILVPTPMPLGTVATSLANDAFGITVTRGSNVATVDVSTTSGSATLVYQVDRTNGVVTVSSIDITTASGLTALANGLAIGSKVEVFALPQPAGTLKAYVIVYFTGDQPS